MSDSIRKSGSRKTVSSFKILFLYFLASFFPDFLFPDPAQPSDFAPERRRMVEDHLRARDIRDPLVLKAMSRVPRHRFVPPDEINLAYADFPLPISEGQTISQPYIVALMTQSAKLGPEDRVLEVGTGSGYQSAVLAEIVKEVYTIEIVPTLAAASRDLLQSLGYDNVTSRQGDGYKGWPEQAPFDAILLTAAAPRVPEPLLDQLKVGGRLILPLEAGSQQELVRFTREREGVRREVITTVRFVPMTGDVRAGEGR